MKTILNTTSKPIRVPLPRGKVLHLGPHMSGKIAHQDLDHPPLQRLLEEKTIEVQDDKAGDSNRPAPYERPGRPTRFKGEG